MKLKDRISALFGGIRRFFRRLWNGRYVISDLFKHKHRFIVLDTDTYKEKISFQLSGSNLFVFFGITALVLIILTALVLAFTPLRELIPGYTNRKMVAQTYANARVIDSLESQLKAQEEMLADIKDIMMGKDPGQRHGVQSEIHRDSTVKPEEYRRSAADSALRQDVEGSGGERVFATPLKGKVVKRFNAGREVFGVTIEGKNGDDVAASQRGVVLFTDNNGENTYTVVIQHPGNIVSVYKASGTLLHKTGEWVDAGEPIINIKAAKNNTTTLYYELRRNGEAINPEKYL